MTFAYQPSAAGISWLSMCQNTVSTMEREQALLALSATTTDVQTTLTLTNSTQTLKELNDQAQGMEQSAWCSMGGAIGGMLTSLGTGIGTALNSPKTTTPAENDITVTEKNINPANESGIEMSEMRDNGAASLDAQNPSPTTASTAASKPAAEEKGSALQNYLSSHGSYLSSFVNSGGQAIGNIQQAAYTQKQAQDKALETIAEGIASVMSSMQGMLTSAISSCDTFFNNTEGNFTTIIQVSAVRG